MSEEKIISRKYSLQFKHSVVMENIKYGIPIAQLSKKYSVNDSLLRKWKKRYLEYGNDGLCEKKRGRPLRAEMDVVTELRAVIRNLEKRIESLESENRVLKDLHHYIKGYRLY